MTDRAGMVRKLRVWWMLPTHDGISALQRRHSTQRQRLDNLNDKDTQMITIGHYMSKRRKFITWRCVRGMTRKIPAQTSKNLHRCSEAQMGPGVIGRRFRRQMDETNCLEWTPREFSRPEDGYLHVGRTCSLEELIKLYTYLYCISRIRTCRYSTDHGIKLMAMLE
ncbi:hypothetical protein KIN20_025168 [Parelaphostrongylus tenuis]|uniref:Uncharacterized protein n=1 Tax=Parelaphostrongylus tenuis TaxID=148309 RepID=A0AAD5NBP5_PARTN|nr:hypothetical protein KIN20_025168 [Parelaphostrongylus tenuis]